MTEYSPYRPPAAALDDPALPPHELADRGSRLAAKILDGVFAAVLAFACACAAFFIVPVFGLEDPDEQTNTAIGLMFVAIIGSSLVILTWNAVWISKYGQTIGKRVLRIKIVRTNGSRVSLLRVIFLRWLPFAAIGFIPIIGFLVNLLDPLMIFSASQRCLHDLIADTDVVRA